MQNRADQISLTKSGTASRQPPPNPPRPTLLRPSLLRPNYLRSHQRSPLTVRPDQSDSLVDGREIILLAAVLALHLATSISISTDERYLTNVIGPGALLICMLLGAWWHLKRQPYAIWQPIFWFRVAVAAYYGVGGLAPFVANDATALFIRNFYNFSDDEAFKIAGINIACALTVLTVAWLIPAWTPKLTAASTSVATARSSNNFKTIIFAAAFLIIGGLSRYVIVLPATFGLIESVPGIFMLAAKSYIVGLFLLIIVALRGNTFAFILAAILVPLDLAVGLLTFSKSEILLTLLFCYLAILHQKMSPQRILIGVVLIFGIFSQLDPVIHYGRDEIYRRYATRGAPLNVRIEILESYTKDVGADVDKLERQSFLSRLSYTNVATMVTTWYDIGRPGDSLKNAFIVLIPRAIWPEKPNITAIGNELYLAAASDEGSSISPGLFAESYWNFGWAGVFILMPFYSAILVALSRLSLAAMKYEDWLYLPASLLSIQIGTRVDGWYVSDVIGAGATALLMFFAVYALERFFLAPRSQPNSKS